MYLEASLVLEDSHSLNKGIGGSEELPARTQRGGRGARAGTPAPGHWL
jgi:hypothetical protein